MRNDTFNLHIDPVRTEMTSTQRITISHVCSSNDSKTKGIITDENLSQVYSTEKSESEGVFVNESYTEDIE